MGYNSTNVKEFLQAQSDTLTHPNIALDLRVINAYQYMWVGEVWAYGDGVWNN